MMAEEEGATSPFDLIRRALRSTQEVRVLGEPPSTPPPAVPYLLPSLALPEPHQCEHEDVSELSFDVS